MHLTHSFTIPAGLEDTWAHFQDISAVAECFPGAKVTSAEGDDFTGTAKVKLGPVALQYAGSGSFVQRDDSAHRMVFEAKGKDKRGNGTAGATVTLAFSAEGDATRADVATDLSVTGKPAQFGQRMMQEVSDKLLGQFVDCLQQRVGGGVADTGGAKAGDAAATAAAATGVSPDEVGLEAAAAEGRAASAAASAGGEPPRTEPEPPRGRQEAPALSTAGAVPGARPPATGDEALDLGRTVLPVVARMYGKQILAAVLALLVLRWVLRRRR